MRICILSQTYPSLSAEGASCPRRVLAVALAQAGHEVYVVTLGTHPIIRSDNGVTVHEIAVAEPRDFVQAHQSINTAITYSQALYEGAYRIHVDQPVDIIDVPLWAAQGLVATYRFAATVVSIQETTAQLIEREGRAPSSSERLLIEIEQTCLRLAGGILCDSLSRLASLQRAYTLPQSIPIGVIDPGLVFVGLQQYPLLAVGDQHDQVHQSLEAGFLVQTDELANSEMLAQRTGAYYKLMLAESRRSQSAPGSVYQVMEAIDIGDAVSDITFAHAERLTLLDEPPDILARYAHEQRQRYTMPLDTAVREGSAIIFHYWNYNDSVWLLDAVRGPKAVYYHNMTPAMFFDPGSAAYETALRGDQQLRQIADRFDLVVGDSRYNVDEFQQYMTRRVPSIHIYPVVDATQYQSAEYSTHVLQMMQQAGCVNIVFVGRIARNKRQDKLMQLFEYYYRTINRNARLWLVGNDRSAPEYTRELQQLRQSLSSRDHIMMTGKIAESELISYYRGADVFVCASEHEGFCVPLAQAMAFDVPVLAHALAAVPETMGSAGVLVHDWHIPRVAEMMHLLISDRQFRQRIIAGQQVNLKRFSEEEALLRLRAVVRYLRDGVIAGNMEL